MEHPDINQHIHCGSLEGEEREKGEEHFINLMKDIDIRAVQQTPSKMNSKRPILRCMMKFLESKIQRESLFIYFCPWWVSVAVRAFLWLRRAGQLSRCDVQASHSSDFSCCWAWALGIQVFSGSRAQAQYLWHMGLVAPRHVGSQIKGRIHVSCIGRWILYHWVTKEAPENLRSVRWERLVMYKVLVTQSCLTPCDPLDCIPPDSSFPGILQARILEWVACKTQNSGLRSKEEKPRNPINQPSRCNTQEGLLSVVQTGDSDLLGGRAHRTANWASFL